MNIGKIPANILENIISKYIGVKKKEVLVGASIGEDCALLSVNDENIVLSTDPITGTVNDLARLALNINVNDIVASGAVPIGVVLTILLPETTTLIDFENLMEQVNFYAKKLNLQVLGGHTEVTSAVNRPIISTTIIGKTINKRFISTSNAKVGQKIIMTKWAGLEGTSIIANEKKEELSKVFDEKFIFEAINTSNFLSILKESQIALQLDEICMHDVTEGGIFGACWEIAHASKCGINIYLENIPILKVTKKICNYFDINPYKLISSGSLLITTFNADKLITLLKNENINAAIIGEIVEKKQGKNIIFNGKLNKFDQPQTDELYKIIF